MSIAFKLFKNDIFADALCYNSGENSAAERQHREPVLPQSGEGPFATDSPLSVPVIIKLAICMCVCFCQPLLRTLYVCCCVQFPSHYFDTLLSRDPNT